MLKGNLSEVRRQVEVNGVHRPQHNEDRETEESMHCQRDGIIEVMFVMTNNRVCVWNFGDLRVIGTWGTSDGVVFVISCQKVHEV